jgi:hypothetical protein
MMGVDVNQTPLLHAGTTPDVIRGIVVFDGFDSAAI